MSCYDGTSYYVDALESWNTFDFFHKDSVYMQLIRAIHQKASDLGTGYSFNIPIGYTGAEDSLQNYDWDSTASVQNPLYVYQNILINARNDCSSIANAQSIVSGIKRKWNNTNRVDCLAALPTGTLTDIEDWEDWVDEIREALEELQIIETFPWTEVEIEFKFQLYPSQYIDGTGFVDESQKWQEIEIQMYESYGASGDDWLIKLAPSESQNNFGDSAGTVIYPYGSPRFDNYGFTSGVHVGAWCPAATTPDEKLLAMGITGSGSIDTKGILTDTEPVDLEVWKHIKKAVLPFYLVAQSYRERILVDNIEFDLSGIESTLIVETGAGSFDNTATGIDYTFSTDIITIPSGSAFNWATVVNEFTGNASGPETTLSVTADYESNIADSKYPWSADSTGGIAPWNTGIAYGTVVSLNSIYATFCIDANGSLHYSGDFRIDTPS